MKKVYTLCALALLSCVFVSAQMVQSNSTPGKNTTTIHSNPAARHAGPTAANHTAAVIWSDDFSTPANWVMDSVAGTTGNWTISQSGPNGGFPINPIFTQGEFAKFDSDSICQVNQHNQIANLTTVNPIDLTGHPDVRLGFAQYYRRFHDSTYVFISTDNSNWTKFEVNGNRIVNEFSENDDEENPAFAYVDISSVAGNQDSVYIRFQFYSPDTNAAGADPLAGCAYAWMIDDVSIVDMIATDARIAVKKTAGEYTSVPIIQPEAIERSGRIVNWGTNPITGAKIIFNVYDGNGLVHTDSSAVSGTINRGDSSALLTALNTFAPQTIDNYFVEQVVVLSGDGDSSNDSTSVHIAVSDSVMARDIYAISNSPLVSTLGFDNSTGTMGEIFHVYNASQFSSATFFLNNPTVGDRVSVSVYSVTGGVPDALLGSTDTFTIAGTDTITLGFPVYVFAQPGDFFVALNQLDTHNVRLGVSNKIYTPNKGFFNIAGGAWNTFEPVNLVSLVLRINNPSATLSTSKIVKESAFNIYPNPSTGIVYISGKDRNEKNVTVDVIDNLGKTVKSFRFGQITTNQIDLSSLPAGLYNISIRSEKSEMNKSIVLQ